MTLEDLGRPQNTDQLKNTEEKELGRASPLIE